MVLISKKQWVKHTWNNKENNNTHNRSDDECKHTWTKKFKKNFSKPYGTISLFQYSHNNTDQNILEHYPETHMKSTTP
jgi:hypothetical protein